MVMVIGPLKNKAEAKAEANARRAAAKSSAPAQDTTGSPAEATQPEATNEKE
jgi:translation initiation factor IF-3